MKIRKTLWDMTQEERKEANEQIEFYMRKFLKLSSTGHGIPMAQDEQFKFCKPPYPPYWIVTSYARIFSLYGKVPKELKPYIQSNNPYRKYIDGEHRTSFLLHRIVADHFCTDYANIKGYHVHHIKPARLFTAEENEKNVPHRASNLQIVEPQLQHYTLTQLQAHPTIKASEAEEHIQHDLEYLKNVCGDVRGSFSESSIKEYIRQFIAQGGKPIITATDDNGSAWLQEVTDLDLNNIEPYAVILNIGY